MVTFDIYMNWEKMFSSKIESSLAQQHRLQSATLKMELNKAGSLELVFPYGHLFYDKYEKLKTIIVVHENGVEIWRGRVLNDETDMFMNKTIFCEGELAFLNDIVVRPYNFENGITVSDFFTYIMGIYESVATEDRRIHAGAVTVETPSYVKKGADATVTDPVITEDELMAVADQVIRGNYGNGEDRKKRLAAAGWDPTMVQALVNHILIGTPFDFSSYRVKATATDSANQISLLGPKNENGGSCLSELLNNLVDPVGGYLYLYKTANNGRSYLGYSSIWTDNDSQVIRFGVNITDIKQSSTAEDIYTVIIPYGKTQENNTKLTIASVNSGRDWLEVATGINKFGKVEKIVDFSSIEDPNILKSEAQKLLNQQLSVATTITINAIDMHFFDAGATTIQVGDLVEVVAQPQGINAKFFCSAVERDLLNPANDTYTFGNPEAELTARQKSSSNYSSTSVGSSSSSYTGSVSTTTTTTGAAMNLQRITNTQIDGIVDA